ncbi:MAG: hypothetical protein KatS3mg065_0394 [Chloroflexota bacterium]|nr:MAG: hypothetical protein KatS3mg065_0394 [Chloroflexota bacterium]
MGPADEGPEIRRRGEGVADTDALEELPEACDEGRQERSLDVEAGGGRAVLAAVDEGPGRRPAGRRFEVGVGEDEDGRLPAELEVDPLEGRRGGRHDGLPGLGVAGEGEHVDVGMAGDRRPDRVAAAGDDVEDAVGQAGLPGELGEAEGGEGRRRGGLEDDRVAGRQGRTDLPDRHPEGIVPGRHLADDADRLAADEARVAAGVLGRPLALEDPGRPGEEAEVVDGEGEVRFAAELVGRPGLEGLDPGQLVGLGLDAVGEAPQDGRPLAGREATPDARLEGAPGGGDGGIDVVDGPLGDPADELAGRRAADLEPGPGAGGRRSTIDDHRDVGTALQGRHGWNSSAAPRPPAAARYALPTARPSGGLPTV